MTLCKQLYNPVMGLEYDYYIFCRPSPNPSEKKGWG